MSEVLPIWHPSACIPREEVLKGKLTDAELALRLSTIVKGEAKPPYNTPESFFNATHLTKNMKLIIENVFGRISGTKGDVNPVIVLDVGFGGGENPHDGNPLLHRKTRPQTRNIRENRQHSNT
jgi:hypothetical protein